MSPPHNPPNQLRFSPLQLSFPTDHRRCSKAQMCLFNILHIISVFPTVNITNDKYLTHDDEISENRGLVVDLNIRLHPPPEADRFNSPATTSGDAVGENCVFEKNDQSSEISHVGDQSSGVDFNSVSELVVEEEEEEGKPRDEGYLGLLIEAAQLVLGDDSDNQEKKPVTGRKRKPECWTPEWYEDTSPVVKSKRERSQVLPYKYRDSVVEPLVRWTSPAMSQRLFSNATVRSKRSWSETRSSEANPEYDLPQKRGWPYSRQQVGAFGRRGTTKYLRTMQLLPTRYVKALNRARSYG